MVTSSRSPSENGSVISNESGKPSSGRRSPQNVMAQQKVTKEEARKRNGEKPSLPAAAPSPSHTHLCTHRCPHSHAATCLHPRFYSLVCPRKGRSLLPASWDITCPPSLNYPVARPLLPDLMELPTALEKPYAECTSVGFAIFLNLG